MGSCIRVVLLAWIYQYKLDRSVAQFFLMVERIGKKTMVLHELHSYRISFQAWVHFCKVDRFARRIKESHDAYVLMLRRFSDKLFKVADTSRSYVCCAFQQWKNFCEKK